MKRMTLDQYHRYVEKIWKEEEAKALTLTKGNKKLAESASFYPYILKKVTERIQEVSLEDFGGPMPTDPEEYKDIVSTTPIDTKSQKAYDDAEHATAEANAETNEERDEEKNEAEPCDCSHDKDGPFTEEVVTSGKNVFEWRNNSSYRKAKAYGLLGDLMFEFTFQLVGDGFGTWPTDWKELRDSGISSVLKVSIDQLNNYNDQQPRISPDVLEIQTSMFGELNTLFKAVVKSYHSKFGKKHYQYAIITANERNIRRCEFFKDAFKSLPQGWTRDEALENQMKKSPNRISQVKYFLFKNPSGPKLKESAGEGVHSLEFEWADRLAGAGLNKEETIGLLDFYLENPEEIPEGYPDIEEMYPDRDKVVEILNTSFFDGNMRGFFNEGNLGVDDLIVAFPPDVVAYVRKAQKIAQHGKNLNDIERIMGKAPLSRSVLKDVLYNEAYNTNAAPLREADLSSDDMSEEELKYLRNAEALVDEGKALSGKDIVDILGQGPLGQDWLNDYFFDPELQKAANSDLKENWIDDIDDSPKIEQPIATQEAPHFNVCLQCGGHANPGKDYCNACEGAKKYAKPAQKRYLYGDELEDIVYADDIADDVVISEETSASGMGFGGANDPFPADAGHDWKKDAEKQGLTEQIPEMPLPDKKYLKESRVGAAIDKILQKAPEALKNPIKYAGPLTRDDKTPFSSKGEIVTTINNRILQYSKEHPESKITFDPGTREIKGLSKEQATALRTLVDLDDAAWDEALARGKNLDATKLIDLYHSILQQKAMAYSRA